MKAHELIDSRDKWCQHEYTRYDEKLQIISARCALAALDTACNIGEWFNKREKLISRIGERFRGNIGGWNDSNSYETVYGTLKELDI